MKTKILFPVFLTLAGCSLAAAQAVKPFAEADRNLSKKFGWQVSQEPAVIDAFSRERRRLGKRFQAEPLKYPSDGARGFQTGLN